MVSVSFDRCINWGLERWAAESGLQTWIHLISMSPFFLVLSAASQTELVKGYQGCRREGKVPALFNGWEGCNGHDRDRWLERLSRGSENPWFRIFLISQLGGSGSKFTSSLPCPGCWLVPTPLDLEQSENNPASPSRPAVLSQEYITTLMTRAPGLPLKKPSSPAGSAWQAFSLLLK